jgi:hypothetical protein
MMGVCFLGKGLVNLLLWACELVVAELVICGLGG